jgi:hypothetical protein
MIDEFLHWVKLRNPACEQQTWQPAEGVVVLEKLCQNCLARRRCSSDMDHRPFGNDSGEPWQGCLLRFRSISQYLVGTSASSRAFCVARGSLL